MGLAETFRMIRLRPARLLPALVVFALAAATPAPDARACTSRETSAGFSGLALGSPDVPADAGILVRGNAKGIARENLASALVVVAKVGDRVVPTESSVASATAVGDGLLFALRIVPKETLAVGTAITIELSSSESLVPPNSPLVATIGPERLADLESFELTIVSPTREQLPDLSQSAVCMRDGSMGASGCGGPTGSATEYKFRPRFAWAHTARTSITSKWRDHVLAAYADVSVSVPSSVPREAYDPATIATTASGRVCVDATITLATDPSFKRTKQNCLDLAALPSPTDAEQQQYEETRRAPLQCASVRYADGTTKTVSSDSASTPSDDAGGCSVGSHAGSSGTTSAFGALVALAMAGAARLRRRR